MHACVCVCGHARAATVCTWSMERSTLARQNHHTAVCVQWHCNDAIIPTTNQHKQTTHLSFVAIRGSARAPVASTSVVTMAKSFILVAMVMVMVMVANVLRSCDFWYSFCDCAARSIESCAVNRTQTCFRFNASILCWCTSPRYTQPRSDCRYHRAMIAPNTCQTATNACMKVV